jgi:serine/threonine protein phosphatase PrpC
VNATSGRLNIPIRAISSFASKGRRPAQEDHYLVDRDKGVFIMADGFGGPIAGREAARTACESVQHFLFKEAGDPEATLPFVLKKYFSLAGNVLFNALIFANQKVNDLNKGKNIHEKGGASILAGFIDGNLLALASVGVCSGWLFREGKCIELVVPRSFGRLRDPFDMDPPMEYRAPLIALGMYEDLEPEIVEYKIRPKDWLVLNTDGILNQVIQQIAAIQIQNLGLEAVAAEVGQYLDSIQFEDNASISLVIF